MWKTPRSGAPLTDVSQALAGTYAIAAAAAFSGLLADTDLTPAQVRDTVMGGQPLPHGRTIYQRAHDRGEIDLQHAPAAVLDMPFDLVPHDLLMDLRPPKPCASGRSSTTCSCPSCRSIRRHPEAVQPAKDQP